MCFYSVLKKMVKTGWHNISLSVHCAGQRNGLLPKDMTLPTTEGKMAMRVSKVRGETRKHFFMTWQL